MVEPDHVAGANEPVPELDVLDARALKALVEPADSTKRVGPHCAKPRPERLRDWIGRLVNVGVRQVHVLRDEVRLDRLLVVRAERGIDRRIASEQDLEFGQTCRWSHDIGVDEDKQIAAGEIDSRAAIASDSRTRRAVDVQDSSGHDARPARGNHRGPRRRPR